MEYSAVVQRFWGYVEKKGTLARGMTSRCWEWKGGVDWTGYGEYNITAGHVEYAHRYAWELAGGPRSTRSHPIHHLCGNKRCVNPNHMAIVTRNAHSALHTVILNATCRNRHPFDEENPLIDGKGNRRCRECARESRRRYKEKQRKRDDKRS